MSANTFYAASPEEPCRAETQFSTVFDVIKKKLEYSSSWENGTGYFDRACYEVKLAVGELATSVDTLGRRMIFIGMPGERVVVVFPRYTGRIFRRNPLVMCENSMLATVLGFNGGALTGDDFERLFSYFPEGDLLLANQIVHRSNLGFRLAEFIDYTAQPETLSFYNMRKRRKAEQAAEGSKPTE